MTPQRLHAELHKNYLVSFVDEDIVHASWRHGGAHEQGTASGSWSWIISKWNGLFSKGIALSICVLRYAGEIALSLNCARMPESDTGIVRGII